MGNSVSVYADPGAPPLSRFWPRFCPAPVGESSWVVGMVVECGTTTVLGDESLKARECLRGLQEALQA